MLDVQSLERQWLRYKLKRSLPYMAVIIISVIGYGAYNTFTSSKPAVPTVAQPNETPQSKPTPLPVVTQTNDVVLEPSMSFMQSMDNTPEAITSVPVTTTISHNETIKRPPVPVAVPLPKETVIQPIVPQKETMTVKPTPIDKKTPAPIVKREESPLNINELQNRFQTAPNANLGVFIAKYHYDHGNYTEAYNYALKTNAINNKIEDSWLIFAKSLVKLGKTDQAKKTLQLYISQSNSTTAKSLLDSLDKDNTK